MGTEVYPFTDFIGGNAGCVDKEPVAALGALDAGRVSTATMMVPYTLNATSGVGENSPWIIAPDDVGGGDQRWEMISVHALGFEATVPSGDPKIVFDIGGTDKWYIGVDDDDGDKLVIGTGGTVGANSKISLDGTNIDCESQNLTSVGTIGCGAITTSGTLASTGQFITLDHATNPALIITDTTNTCEAKVQAGNTSVFIGSKSAHSLYLIHTDAIKLTLTSTDFTLADGVGLNLQEDITFLGATTVNQIKFPDTLAVALAFQEGANLYQTFVTTNGSEAVVFHKDVDINVHDAATVGLKLGGTLVTASAAEINALDGISANGTSLIQAANYAAMMALLSGEAGAAFSLNSQNLTNVGDIGAGTSELTIGSINRGADDLLFEVAGNLGAAISGDETIGDEAQFGGTGTYLFAADHHATGANAMVVNVCYGTGEPPAANTTPIGSLYIKYVA